jgi:hypothetical protein
MPKGGHPQVGCSAKEANKRQSACSVGGERRPTRNTRPPPNRMWCTRRPTEAACIWRRGESDTRPPAGGVWCRGGQREAICMWLWWGEEANTRPPPSQVWCRGGQQRPPTYGMEEKPTRGHLLVGYGREDRPTGGPPQCHPFGLLEPTGKPALCLETARHKSTAWKGNVQFVDVKSSVS